MLKDFEKVNIKIENYQCLVIENFENNINENLFYSSIKSHKTT